MRSSKILDLARAVKLWVYGDMSLSQVEDLIDPAHPFLWELFYLNNLCDDRGNAAPDCQADEALFVLLFALACSKRQEFTLQPAWLRP